ncbi:hypothetical protein Ocin01_02883 [Orchesella cincta]|uniref:Uncharacterized protein n=1 Tax=Orchesella cincta TaxID=48709 RepID=A0A1D2NFQ4_ORCCI|nr:hypothetical protein Ocin01_02883 [Orchesella cincta]
MESKRRKSRIPVYIHKRQSVSELSTSTGSSISSTGSTEERSEPQISPSEDDLIEEPISVKSKLRKLEIRLNVLKYDNLQREIALEKLSEDMVKRIAALEERMDTFTNDKSKKCRSQEQGGEEVPQSA